ncbi:hypothetical protein KR093_001806, partial [Drosophila rubida]
TASMAQLQSISMQGLHKLQVLYRQEWPKYCQEYHVLSTVIEFMKTDPDINHLNVYTLSDVCAKECGVFLIVDRYQLFVGCLGDSFELLEQALHQLDWSRGFQCSTVLARYLATISKVFQAKELPISFEFKSNLYILPAKQAKELSVKAPEGFYLDTLSESDAELVNDEWPNHHVGSLYFVQRQIRLCPSVGLYASDTKQLVAWCIRLQGGYLGALQVSSSHKRRGFGSLITQEITRRIGCMGQDVMALVNPQNTPSCSMFEKLGFKVIDQCYWQHTQPFIGKFTWPDGE